MLPAFVIFAFSPLPCRGLSHAPLYYS
jgi:hypothetical protein